MSFIRPVRCLCVHLPELNLVFHDPMGGGNTRHSKGMNCIEQTRIKLQESTGDAEMHYSFMSKRL